MRGSEPWGVLFLTGLIFCNPAAAEEGSKGFFAQLGKSASYTVEGYTSYFPQDHHSTPARIVDDRSALFWTRAMAKSQVFLRESLVFKAATFATYSTQGDELRGVFSLPDQEAPNAHFVELKEFSLRYDQQRFAVTVGRAPIPVGLSTLYSPADRYRVISGANPTKPEDLGAWQASMDLFMGDNTLRLSVLPFEERSSAPYGHSRWVGSADSSGFAQSSTTTSGMAGGATGLTVPEGGSARVVSRNRPGFLAKYSGVTTGADYFVSLHYGPSIYPVLHNPSDSIFLVEVPRALTGSAGMAKTIGAWELHSEAAYQETESGEDQSFLKYVVAGTYRETAAAGKMGLDEIAPTVEYAGDCVTNGQNGDGYVQSSFKARPFTSSLLFKVDFVFSDKVTAVIGGIRNFIGNDYTHAFGVEYRLNDNLTWKAGVVFFGGRSGTPFGRWDRNDYFEIGMARKF